MLRRLLAGSVVFFALGCSQTRPGVWTANAPKSAEDTGFIVQTKAPAKEELEQLLLEHNGQGRILSEVHGLYEIHGVPAEKLESLGHLVEKNLYMPNLVSSRKASRLKAFADGGKTSDLENKLREGGIEPCVAHSRRPSAHVTPSTDLSTGVIERGGPMKFDGSMSSAHAQHPSALRFAFEVLPPRYSKLGHQLVIQKQMEFEPDALGVYSVTMLVQDERRACSFAELDFVVTANPEFASAPSAQPLSASQLAKFTQIATVEAAAAWKKSQGENIVIAIVDTGVHYNHPDLVANILINEKEIPANGIDDDHNGFVDDVYGWDFAYSDNKPYDDQGHGTHVAGLAASATMGIAPKAKILAIKGLDGAGGGDLASIVASIYYAVDRGAHVINASLGSSHPMMKVLKKSVSYAESKGVILVAAAGNGDEMGRGVDNDRFPSYPSSLENNNIIAVASTEGEGLTSYSNYGKESVDVAAPGGGRKGLLYSTAAENPHGARFVGLAGTSMATPVVAGIVALGLSLQPQLTAAELMASLLVSGPELDALKGKVRSERLISAADFVQKISSSAQIN